MNEQAFYEALLKQGIELSNHQLEQFATYYSLLVEWNEKMNLTAIIKKEDVYEKHFYDSLTLAFKHPLKDQKLLDVGAGAGFPSLPLKIAFPSLQVFVLDSLAKRMVFVEHVIKTLNLTSIKTIINRAEEEAKINKEKYDIVTARAVARLNILSELCLPLVKVNGYFIPLKGSSGLEELDEAKKGIEILGGKVDFIQELNLITNEDKRYNIFIKKVSPTNKNYPRSFASIKNKPL